MAKPTILAVDDDRVVLSAIERDLRRRYGKDSRIEGGRWIVTESIESIDIPDTLLGVILARINRLPEEAKRTLQIASMIGRRFQVKVMEMVLEPELSES